MNRSILKTKRVLGAAVTAVILTVVPSGWAQENPNDREMTVSPKEAHPQEGVFAFSQEIMALRQENAATLYLQAFGQWPSSQKLVEGGQYESQDELLEMDLEAFDVEKGKAFLDPYSLPLQLTEPAVRRTQSAWGSPLEEQGVATLLPYLNQTRYLANVLAIRARTEAAQGDFKAAADTFQRMYILADHVGNAAEPVLIDGLVGVGIAQMATKHLGDVTELPEAPNRYWALTTLPTPMFEFSRWMNMERRWIVTSFPGLEHPELMDAPRFVRMIDQLESWDEDEENPLSPKQVALSVGTAVVAADYLLERGYTQEQLEQDGVFPTLARIMLEEYFGYFDQMAKLVHLPFPEAHQHLGALEAQLQESASGPPDVGRMLAHILLPSISRAFEAPNRLQRQIDMLRIVEAVRDHVAVNGQLPASLDEIRLPIPEDVMTGQPFGYKVEGRTFTLTAAPYAEGRDDSDATWTVTVRE